MALPGALQPNGAVATDFGIEVRITPANPPSYGIELQRAPDDGSGAPNVGAVATIIILPPLRAGGASYVDLLPPDDAFRHYRWRHVADGYDPSTNWTPWGRGKPALLPAQLAQGGLIGVYPIMRALALTDGKYAVVAADAAGVKVDRPVGVDGAVRTLYTALTHLLPNGEFEVWQSASQPHGFTVDTGDSSVAAKDTSVVFSGDAAAKFSFGAGGSAATWRGFATNDPTKGGQCIPLRPGFRYRVIAASRVSTLTGPTKYRLRFQYDAGGTLTDEKQIAYRAATTYQRDEFVISVPSAADPNTKFWVEFQRGDTSAKDFWVDSVRFEEEVASLADQAAQLASQGTSFVLNGYFEEGTAYWRQTSGGSLFKTSAAPPDQGIAGAILTVGGSTHRVQQCDRSTDLVDSADGNPIYIPVNPFDEIWGVIAFGTLGVISASSTWQFGIEEYDAAKALIQRQYIGSGPVVQITTQVLRGGVVLSATTKYVVAIIEVLPVAGYTGVTIKFDALNLFWNAKKERCHRYKAADQTGVVSGTETKVVLDTTLWQVSTMDGTADRITLPTDFPKSGTVTIRGQVEFAGPATPAGYRQVRVKKNGTTFLAKTRVAAVVTANLETTVQVAVEDHLAAPADFYELWATHNQGANMTLTHASDLTFLQVVHRP